MILAIAPRHRALAAAAAFAAAFVPWSAARAAEFSVTPIHVELKPGTLTETITVTNHAHTRLRVRMRLQEWTQDASGADVYQDSADLVYFPRQMEIEGDAKRIVRVGIKTPAALTERAYRLYVEEEPDAAASTGRAQVAFYFRFGVPIFLAPAAPRPQPEVGAPRLAAGKVSVVVRNAGNEHFRLTRVALTDGGTFSAEVAGWYSLAGSTRTYVLDVPPDVCRKARTLDLSLEGDGIHIDRKLDVDPANCA